MSTNQVSAAAGAGDEAETRLRWWERRTEWPMVGLSVLFLGLYAWMVLDTGLTPTSRQRIDAVMWVLWAAFAVDYLVRLGLARRRLRFVLHNAFDLLVLLLPLLRQLRVLRLVVVLLTLNRRVQARVRGQVVLYVSGAVVLLGLSAALAVLEVERTAPDAKITGFADALWWTMTTVTTVGYGDYYPVTGQGKLIAAGLMIAGIALLGVVTGSIASWFVDRFGGLEQSVSASADATRRLDAESDRLRAEIVVLREEITALRTELSSRDRR